MQVRESRGRRLWILETGLLVAGLLGLAVVTLDLVERATTQDRLRDELELALSSLTEGGRNGDTHSQAGIRGPGRDGLVGEIRIDRIHLQAMVAEGTDAQTLQGAVGHLADTAYPGENGNSVLAGHRDSFFRGLKDVEESDRIDVVTPDGTFQYVVVSTRVVPHDAMDVLAPSNKPVLTLVTCYPFSYIGHAPERFIVVAEEVERPRSTRL